MNLKKNAPVEDGRSGNLRAPKGVAVHSGALALTYQDLLNKFLADASSPADKSHRSWAVSIWTEALGVAPVDAVRDELSLDFEAELTRLRNQMTKTKAVSTSNNFASAMRNFRALYQRELHGGNLPDKFSDVIQLGLKRLGKSANSLRKNFSEGVYHWAAGNTTPKRNSSLAVVHQLEEYLELPHNSLVVRAHCKPEKVQDLSKDVPWRRYNAKVGKFKFRLKPDQVPAALSSDIEALIVHKRKADHLMPDGSIVSLGSNETWNTQATIDIRTESLYAFFGFLVLPKATKPDASMSWEETLGHGLGLPIASLRLTMVLNREYLFAYLLYCQMRTFDKAAFEYEEALKQGTAVGERPVRKTVSGSLHDFAVFMNNLVNSPHSFFCLHPQYASLVGITPDQWSVWLAQRHLETCSFARAVNKKVDTGKRSNKDLMQEMLRMENPLELVHQMLDQMRRDIPPATAPVWLACRYRDIALISVWLFDPLRLKNMTQLRIGKEINEVRGGGMTLEIDKTQFKNHIFGHAESRYRVLPADVEADVRKWMKCRSALTGHDKTNLLFMAVQKKPKGKGELFILTRHSVYELLKKHTKNYLGLSFGPNAFRTLLATAVAKVGTPNQVSAILNDSEEVAMNIYRDVRNADEFKALDDIHEQFRASAERVRR